MTSLDIKKKISGFLSEIPEGDFKGFAGIIVGFRPDGSVWIAVSGGGELCPGEVLEATADGMVELLKKMKEQHDDSLAQQRMKTELDALLRELIR